MLVGEEEEGRGMARENVYGKFGGCQDSGREWRERSRRVRRLLWEEKGRKGAKLRQSAVLEAHISTILLYAQSASNGVPTHVTPLVYDAVCVPTCVHSVPPSATAD